MSARHLAFAETIVPPRIGKYIVSDKIGEGAMGVVYRAVDPQIHRHVAIKTIRQPLRWGDTEGGAATQRFRREAQAAGRLNHPNIVSIYECDAYGDSGEDLFIAMECVDGPSLAALAELGVRLALPDVLAVMLQLLDALHCAHQQKVWHCDIKPSNLLVTNDGRLKVTDFGIARVESSDLTVRNALWGSPGYMAPERYAGGAVDQRVDIFSCGVLLYELLTGAAPFSGSSSAVMYQVLQQNPPPPSTVAGAGAPPACDGVVARALAKHPGDRFASALEMRDALLVAVPADTARQLLSADALGRMRRPPPGTTAATVTMAWPDTIVAPKRAAAVMPAQPAAAAMPTLQAAGATAPRPSVGTGPSLLDPQALAQVEALLRPCLGAMARIVVRETARRTATIPALIARIAEESLTPAERAPFLAQAKAVAGHAAAPAPVPAPAAVGSGAVPVLGQTPMRADTVDKAGRALAALIGPIALLLARRAATAATSREQYYCALADSAGDSVDRKTLLDRLWQID